MTHYDCSPHCSILGSYEDDDSFGGSCGGEYWDADSLRYNSVEEAETWEIWNDTIVKNQGLAMQEKVLIRGLTQKDIDQVMGISNLKEVSETGTLIN